MPLPAYLTTAEVAEYLRLKERKVYDLVSQGVIPCVRVTGKLLFPRQRIDLWLMNHLKETMQRARRRHRCWQEARIRCLSGLLRKVVQRWPCCARAVVMACNA